jgi:hypothetical protein
MSEGTTKSIRKSLRHSKTHAQALDEFAEKAESEGFAGKFELGESCDLQYWLTSVWAFSDLLLPTPTDEGTVNFDLANKLLAMWIHCASVKITRIQS